MVAASKMDEAAVRPEARESPPVGKRRRGLRALAAGALFVATAAAAFAWWMATLPVVIEMEDAPAGGFYYPDRITVRAGTIVQWKNIGQQQHDATDDPNLALRGGDAVYPSGAKAFDSGYLSQGESFTYTFEIPGTYKYVCLPHEFGGMTGEVIVTK